MTSVQNQGNQQVQQLKPVQQQSIQPTAPQVIAPQPIAPPPVAQQTYATSPQVQAPPPSYAGVNIQIYNPSVGIPNINPTGNANVSQGMPRMAYPSNYYTQQFAPQQPQGNIIAQGGQGGNATVYNNLASPTADPNAAGNNKSAETLNAQSNNDTNSNSNKTTETNTTTTTTNTTDKKKTEKRKVVELTDEYIMNLENYLNSQDKEVRMMGAKEVIARLQEDDSRKDDPALTALINKMLQDPSQQIRFLALSMLDSRICTGDDYTIGVLKKMQNSTTGFGQDAAQATNILLKMSGKVIEKEFEVPENSAKK